MKGSFLICSGYLSFHLSNQIIRLASRLNIEHLTGFSAVTQQTRDVHMNGTNQTGVPMRPVPRLRFLTDE